MLKAIIEALRNILMKAKNATRLNEYIRIMEECSTTTILENMQYLDQEVC